MTERRRARATHLRVGPTLAACGKYDVVMSVFPSKVTCKLCARGRPHARVKIPDVPDSGLGILTCKLCGDPLRDHALDAHSDQLLRAPGRMARI